MAVTAGVNAFASGTSGRQSPALHQFLTRQKTPNNRDIGDMETMIKIDIILFNCGYFTGRAAGLSISAYSTLDLCKVFRFLRLSRLTIGCRKVQIKTCRVGIISHRDFRTACYVAMMVGPVSVDDIYFLFPRSSCFLPHDCTLQFLPLIWSSPPR